MVLGKDRELQLHQPCSSWNNNQNKRSKVCAWFGGVLGVEILGGFWSRCVMEKWEWAGTLLGEQPASPDMEWFGAGPSLHREERKRAPNSANSSSSLS